MKWPINLTRLIKRNWIMNGDGKTCRPRETLTKLGLKSSDVFADIGCGIGYFTIPAAEIVGSQTVYALDTVSEMLAEVKQRAADAGLTNIVITQTGEYDLKLTDGLVSFALMVNVIHEIDDKLLFLSEIHRILKPGGTLSHHRLGKKGNRNGTTG